MKTTLLADVNGLFAVNAADDISSASSSTAGSMPGLVTPSSANSEASASTIADFDVKNWDFESANVYQATFFFKVVRPNQFAATIASALLLRTECSNPS